VLRSENTERSGTYHAAARSEQLRGCLDRTVCSIKPLGWLTSDTRRKTTLFGTTLRLAFLALANLRRPPPPGALQDSGNS